MQKFQSFFGVGNISVTKNENRNSVRYVVTSIKDLNNAIIPHFDEYPLFTQKKADFLLFKQAIALINNKEHLTKEGILKLVSIKSGLNLGLTEILNNSFPSIVSEPRPLVLNSDNLDKF